MPSSNAPALFRSGVVFFGEFFHAIDEKNRVSIPAAWRKAGDVRAAQPWILVPAPNAPSLLGFPPDEFEAELQRIGSLGNSAAPFLSAADLQAFSRLFTAKARQCSLDAHGRLLIPSEMLAVGKFGKELALVGNRRRIEIWDKEEWKRRTTADAGAYARVATAAGL